MRIVIIGAGPAGLQLAYLLKRRDPALQVEIYEQNAADATFGFGVVFSERALQFLGESDAELLAALKPALQYWRDNILYLNGREIRIDGMGYTGIGRLALLRILQARAATVGIEPRYQHAIADLAALGEADLIVGADGVNSLVRRGNEAAFGTSLTYLDNRFAWYGTRKRFAGLTHTFVSTELGSFNAHHHPHAPDMSTFLIEVDAPTFFRAGFDQMPLAEAQAQLERVFGTTLDGAPLLSNNSIWRQFPKIANRRWFSGNRVLLGDALHTAHFSIGSGTRLAFEDAIALDRALAQHPRDIAAALTHYQRTRAPILEKLVAAANQSALWYEHFAEHMKRPAMEFALSYITRSGRVDWERLRKSSPEFVAAYENAKAG